MITFTLSGHVEKIAPSTRSGQGKERLLYHQWRTQEALRSHDVVVNTYNTGTGKTRAALQRLIELNGQGINVLFIAPTNELIGQHLRDTQKFVDQHHLDYKVLPARAHDLRAIGGNLRPGEVLVRLIRNYQEFEELSARRKAVVMVTNPDIFYYALYFQYGRNDQRNIFGEFITRFDYIIIDEFHYYNNKQLANFLFAFALFDQFGYFNHSEHQRRICLLSATPRENVMRYLYNLFGNRLALVAPTNEPPESADYETVPTLAPLQVTVVAGNLSEWLKFSVHEVVSWVTAEGLDGAVISNSLARINEAFRVLQGSLRADTMGRITGPEPPGARIDAATAKLILATPTVDLGYNFDKLNKPERQNIDFIVCEAQFRDDLIQRIGRAGRVLGKTRCDIPSRAVVLLSERVVQAQSLRDLNGRTVNRQDFAAQLNQIDELPPKHLIEDYIRFYAIQELIFPIFQLAKIMPGPDELRELDALYTRLYELLVSSGRDRRLSIINSYRKLEHRQIWLKEAVDEKPQPPAKTAEHIADWLAWLRGNGERPIESAVESEVPKLWRDRSARKELIAFVSSQVALTTALFNFRDSFAGPLAVFYDPQGWFSSQPVNIYDVFHLLSNYEISSPMSRQAFIKEARLPSGESVPEGDFYVKLRAPLENPLVVQFALHSELSQQEFDKRWTRIPVAQRGVELQVRERGGDVITGGVHSSIREALAQQDVVCMIVPSEDEGVVRARLLDSGYLWRQLEIYFDGNMRSAQYMLFGGLAAFETHAALRGYFARVQQRSEVLIY